MTRPRLERQDNLSHQDIEAQLPWYVNGTLSASEQTDVERQVAASPELQAHLAAWQHLAEAVQAVEVAVPDPSPERFAALMAHIDAAAEPSTPESIPSIWNQLAARWRALRQNWSDAPGTAQLALGLQCALIALCIAGITLPWPSPAPYRTLSSADSAPRPMGAAQLRLVVADDMTTGELRILLGRIRATIVDGPTAMGVYTLAVSLDTSSALPKALEQALQTLRAHEHVTLAEPI